MKMLRRFNRNGLWKQLFISGETLEETRFDLRKDNIEIMNQCILDAKEIMGKQNAETNGQTMQCMTAIAISLFDKLADASYTRFQAKLDEFEIIARGPEGTMDPKEFGKQAIKQLEQEKKKEELKEEKIKHDNKDEDVSTEELMEVEDGL